MLLNKHNTLKQLTGCLQAGVYKLTLWALQEWLYQLGDANVTKIAWRFKKGYYHRHPSTTDPQVLPNVPGKSTSPNVPQISQIRSWFSSSIRPHLETTLDSSNPRNVILLCTAGLFKSIVDKVWKSRGKIFWTNLLKWYITSNHYIFFCIWYYFIAMTYFKLYIISVISLYPICMV